MHSHIKILVLNTKIRIRFRIIRSDLYMFYKVQGLLRSNLAGYDNACKIDIVVRGMVEHINIQQILVATIFILTRLIVADVATLLNWSLVKYFSVHMQETPVFLWQMRNWISSVGHSGLKMIFSVDLVEPNCKLRISNSWRTKGVKFSDFGSIGEEMGCCMGSNSSTKAMACNTLLTYEYITFSNPNFCLYWATVSRTCFLMSLKA